MVSVHELYELWADESELDAELAQSLEPRGTDWRGVGTTTWNGLAPSFCSASSASWTLSARDWDSERTAQGSPAATLQRAKTSANRSIHLPSIRSAIMRAL